jgi:hypothetical protein
MPPSCATDAYQPWPMFPGMWLQVWVCIGQALVRSCTRVCSQAGKNAIPYKIWRLGFEMHIPILGARDGIAIEQGVARHCNEGQITVQVLLHKLFCEPGIMGEDSGPQSALRHLRKTHTTVEALACCHGPGP